LPAQSDNHVVCASYDQRADQPIARHSRGPFCGVGDLGRDRRVPGAAMNSHDLTVLGYLLLLASCALLGLLAAWTKVRIPSMGQVLTRIMRTRAGRVAVLVVWAWIGLHFFAR